LNIVIRVDGGEHVGMGHIMRCLALADNLIKFNINSIFVIKNSFKSVKNKIEEKNYEIKNIPPNSDINKDVNSTIDIIKKTNSNMAITDLCNTEMLKLLDNYKRYLIELKKNVPFLVTIDDLNLIKFPSDIVINPNYGAEKFIPKSIKNYNSKFLYGVRYYIFRREFLRVIKKQREIREQSENILITMGGNDLNNLTVKVIQSISDHDLSKLNFKIVVGSAYSDDKIKKLLSIIEILNTNYQIITDAGNMAELMLWCDLAFTACGLTRYETAVTGTPSITISQHIYEQKVMQDFKTAGTTEYLGLDKDVTKQQISDIFLDLLSNKKQREKMSRNGKRLVDGKGLARITNEIKNLGYLEEEK